MRLVEIEDQFPAITGQFTGYLFTFPWENSPRGIELDLGSPIMSNKREREPLISYDNIGRNSATGPHSYAFKSWRAVGIIALAVLIIATASFITMLPSHYRLPEDPYEAALEILGRTPVIVRNNLAYRVHADLYLRQDTHIGEHS